MSAQLQVQHEASRDLVSIVASLAPLFALLTLRTRLKLDNVHLVLAQLLVLSILRFAINLTPSKVVKAVQQVESRVTTVTKGGDDDGKAVKKTKRKKKKKTGAKGENPKYDFNTMDNVLYRFLSVVDPDQLDKLGPEPKGSKPAPAKRALTDWTEMFRDEGLVVLKHPDAKAMYAICYRFRDIEMRNLWEILVDINKRPTWDGLCDKTEDLEQLGQKGAAVRPTQRVGSVSWMGMKGMFPVKAKDLVLMSVVAQLPASPSTIPFTPDKPVLRLVCATTSSEHDSKPPNTGGYQRMELDISGFILEEDGEGGTLLTQITDLSGLGSWVPAKIINLVTQTMIPKSLGKIGKRASTLQLEGTRAQLKGTDWLPPELGIWRNQPAGEEATEAEVEPEEEEGDEEDEDVDGEEDEEEATVGSRSLTDLVAQLRALTARLAALESQKNKGGGGSSGNGGISGWLSRLFGSGKAADLAAASPASPGILAAVSATAASAITLWWFNVTVPRSR